MALTNNPTHEMLFVISFGREWSPRVAFDPGKLRQADDALLQATAAIDDITQELSARDESRRETLRLLRMLNRSLTRSANLIHRLAGGPPIDELPEHAAVVCSAVPVRSKRKVH